MNGLGKLFRKKSDPKNRKNSKNQSEIAACEQKTTTDKANFWSNTVFSLYFKISRRKTTRFFVPFPVSAWPKSLLQFDFKNHENVWTDLKKNIAGQVLTYNSKNFHWLNRKTRPGMDYEWIEKTILKKIRSKKRKKQKNVKMPHMNKKTTSEKSKFK